MVFSTHVPTLGRYAFLLHSYQPTHPTFAVEVLVSGGRVWQGEWRWGAVSQSHSPTVWSSHSVDQQHAGSTARMVRGTAPITWL